MSLGRWRRISREVVSRNRWWTYVRDEFELPSGRRGEYHHVETNGSAMTIAVAPDGRIAMVNQYRYLLDRESLEFPCGSVKEGASYDETARHELAEEAGQAAREIAAVGEFDPYNGVTAEICRVYVARGLTPNAAVPDETEEFELLWLTPGEIDARVRSGAIWDGMTIAAWAIARGHVERA